MKITANELNFTNRRTIIVVGSPFQALCAVEAIKTFEIRDYKLYVWEYSGDNRRTQTLNVLSFFDVEAVSIVATRFTSLKYIVKNIFKGNKYDCAILGDVRALDYRLMAISELACGSLILYLDDGSVSVAIFSGVRLANRSLFPYKKHIDGFISWFKGFDKPNTFFTIFSDVPTQKYRLMENDLSHVVSHKQNAPVEKEYVFIGTSPKAYMDAFGLSREEYVKMFCEILRQIKSKYVNVTYIPHGRDYDNLLEPFCTENGIKYQRINICLELYLLQQDHMVSAVGGFTSTALLTIKKMFPKTEVYNYLPERKSDNVDTYKTITEYYKNHGICTVII